VDHPAARLRLGVEVLGLRARAALGVEDDPAIALRQNVEALGSRVAVVVHGRRGEAMLLNPLLDVVTRHLDQIRERDVLDRDASRQLVDGPPERVPAEDRADLLVGRAARDRCCHGFLPRLAGVQWTLLAATFGSRCRDRSDSMPWPT